MNQQFGATKYALTPENNVAIANNNRPAPPIPNQQNNDVHSTGRHASITSQSVNKTKMPLPCLN